MEEITKALKIIESHLSDDMKPISVTIYADSSGVVNDDNGEKVFIFGRSDFGNQFYKFIVSK